MMRLVLIAAALALGAHSAHAGGTIWEQVTAEDDAERPSAAPPAGLSEYDRQMWFGDKASLTATVRRPAGQHVSRVKIYLDYAINAYEKAIAADPTQAEPHYRLGFLILYHYLSKERGYLVTSTSDQRRWRLRLLEHWEKFIELAPLDPRVDNILAERALTHTRLATAEGDEKALQDYELIFARNDVSALGNYTAGILALNRAEMLMVLQRLAEAIEWYQRALELRSDSSTAFGLAVGYDRAGYASRARETMSQFAGEATLTKLIADLQKGATFYVPDGEVYYYFGLMHEVLGSYDLAIDRFERFIASGAHPEFQPRARHNIKLLKRKLARQRTGSLGVDHWTRTWDTKWLPETP